MRTNADGSPRFKTSMSMTASSAAPGLVQDGTQPVRVGGTIREPVKLVDIPAVLPEAARQAGVAGMVIIEVTIGVDGAASRVRA